MRICPECKAENSPWRVTCNNCHCPLYRDPSKPRKTRRTQDEINQAVLEKREGEMEDDTVNG